MLVFVTDPITTLTPGFNLSFGAVVLLLWLARHRLVFKGRWRIVSAPSRLFIMQIFLLFGLAPLTAMIFQRLSLVATPVNLVAVPLFSFVTVPLTLGGLVIASVSESAALYLLRLAAHSIDLLEAYIARMAEMPLAAASLAQINGYALVILLVPLAWVLFPSGWPGRRIAVLGLVAVMLWRPTAPPTGCFDAWTLDVGQGLSVAVQTRDETLLFDTGMAWRGGGSVAEQVILPFLRSRSIRKVDRLVVSHADLDHSGGAAAISNGVEVGAVLLGEPLPGIAGQRCRAGQGWHSGGVDFEFLHPSPESSIEGNDSSCVLRVTAGPHAMLLTGDIEAASERALIRR